MIALLGILLLGVGLRLFDLFDQPLDFHPTRQLRGAIIARGIYYQLLPTADPEKRQLASALQQSTGKYEPPVLETLVALSYLVTGGEKLWISRIYTTIFWMVGGVALYALALRMSRNSLISQNISDPNNMSKISALIVVAYYLVLPLAVQGSRSFQPDPGMVMWIILSIYSLYRWSEEKNWKWAILAGAFAGLAVITKAVAVYMIACAAAAIVIYSLGVKKFWKEPQVWVMASLTLAPSLVFYFSQTSRATEYISSWTLALSSLLLEPGFYIRWLYFVQEQMGLTILLLAAVGAIISIALNRALLLGLWLGYLIYGLSLPYQMYTHNYYHLQLIPVLSLSVLAVVEIIVIRVMQLTKTWRAVILLPILIWIIFLGWNAILPQYAEDHRNEPTYWQEIASFLPADGKVLALTQDYGYRLMYYGWRKVNTWPNRAEQKLMGLRGSEKDFEDFASRQFAGQSYFVVTSFSQFNDQPELKNYLSENYPVLAEGSGYLIFDLRKTGGG